MRPMDNGTKFLQCERCEQDAPAGIPLRNWARLCVAVTAHGHLLVECIRHSEVVAFIKNEDLAKVLRDVASHDCTCADHKETLH